MKRFGMLFGLILLLASVCVSMQRQKTEVDTKGSIQQLNEDSKLNWTGGYIEATGEAAYPSGVAKNQARLMARRGAIVDAQRNLLSSVAGVRLTSETLMKNSVLISDTVQTRLEGIVKGAIVVREQDKGDTFAVTMRMPLGGVASLVKQTFAEPEKFGLDKEDVEKWSPQVVPEEKIKIPEEPPKVAPLPVKPATVQAHTGVMIDCRGLGLQRCMSPKIRRADGSEVWGTVQVDPEFVLEHGIAIYVNSNRTELLNDPLVVKRMGKNPLTIRAIGVAGAGKSDAVISHDDAEHLLQENTRSKFLDKFSVLFIY
jgi:hypothetical protein